MNDSKQSIDRYAVFGNPISHSLSPELHKIFAQQTQQRLTYSAELIEPKNFSSAVNDFFRSGGKGLNITVPFKQAAFELADHLTERARSAEAVNTLFLDNKHALVGDNTDGAGLIIDIVKRLEWDLSQKNILILGAGGAVRGVLEPLLNQKPAAVAIANRTVSKAETLAKLFSHSATVSSYGFDDIPNQVFDIIINATSAGLTGELPSLAAQIIDKNTCCYDMVYAKKLTPFLQWANFHGCKHISDGLGMLVGQGAEAFSIWRGVMPETEPVIKSLQKKL